MSTCASSSDYAATACRATRQQRTPAAQAARRIAGGRAGCGTVGQLYGIGTHRVRSHCGQRESQRQRHRKVQHRHGNSQERRHAVPSAAPRPLHVPNSMTRLHGTRVGPYEHDRRAAGTRPSREHFSTRRRSRRRPCAPTPHLMSRRCSALRPTSWAASELGAADPGRPPRAPRAAPVADGHCAPEARGAEARGLRRDWRKYL